MPSFITVDNPVLPIKSKNDGGYWNKSIKQTEWVFDQKAKKIIYSKTESTSKYIFINAKGAKA